MPGKTTESTIDTRHPSVIESHHRLDRMRDEIIRLGLERNIMELELYGYTVLEKVKPMTFFDELRETILRLGQEDNQAGHRIPLSGPNGNSYLVTWLLARGRIFEEAVMAEKPLEAKKGSVAVFNGNLWHSAGARTLPGERVGMTVYFNRMYVRPQEDLNAVISDEVVARNPPRFAHLIGRNNPYPAKDYGFFNSKGAPYFGRASDPRG